MENRNCLGIEQTSRETSSWGWDWQCGKTNYCGPWSQLARAALMQTTLLVAVALLVLRWAVAICWELQLSGLLQYWTAVWKSLFIKCFLQLYIMYLNCSTVLKQCLEEQCLLETLLHSYIFWKVHCCLGKIQFLLKMINVYEFNQGVFTQWRFYYNSLILNSLCPDAWGVLYYLTAVTFVFVITKWWQSIGKPAPLEGMKWMETHSIEKHKVSQYISASWD